MRRKNKVLEYITAKKYYLSLIGCLIITLIAVGIIYNKDQEYEEIANLNEVPREQRLVENPGEMAVIDSMEVVDSTEVIDTTEVIDIIDPAPEISIHQENVPEIVLDNLPPSQSIVDEKLQIMQDKAPEEMLSEEDVKDDNLALDEDGSLEEFVPVISVQQPNLTFDIDQGMTKPLSGKILIAYSDITPVYFKTLDQYKINQGLYISGELGAEVKVVADGVVEKIEVGANKGYVLTVYHGNGFKSSYGQLKEDMNVKEGDMIYKGDIIGYVEKPTNFYALEGPHLYFEVLENGKPIDPTPILK